VSTLEQGSLEGNRRNTFWRGSTTVAKLRERVADRTAARLFPTEEVRDRALKEEHFNIVNRAKGAGGWVGGGARRRRNQFSVIGLKMFGT
jgi:hypothetical protein